ncbi:uncharacterized protein UV8b_06236 [Ustilaginoidea virens]|uniref:Uncharacterized protein n=1 Tax=Ustilaginoidea virens TaxID=1159556 RepID=A0A8E5HUQ7_USTVR|nr:uncharacterized protein UV8b_06236 [Ustilaginoidea virens]QUC21995.1 hypothetical protein UV8b_06236 [Ustilaginoidea virens]
MVPLTYGLSTASPCPTNNPCLPSTTLYPTFQARCSISRPSAILRSIAVFRETTSSPRLFKIDNSSLLLAACRRWPSPPVRGVFF